MYAREVVMYGMLGVSRGGGDFGDGAGFSPGLPLDRLHRMSACGLFAYYVDEFTLTPARP